MQYTRNPAHEPTTRCNLWYVGIGTTGSSSAERHRGGLMNELKAIRALPRRPHWYSSRSCPRTRSADTHFTDRAIQLNFFGAPEGATRVVLGRERTTEVETGSTVGIVLMLNFDSVFSAKDSGITSSHHLRHLHISNCIQLSSRS